MFYQMSISTMINKMRQDMATSFLSLASYLKSQPHCHLANLPHCNTIYHHTNLPPPYLRKCFGKSPLPQ